MRPLTHLVCLVLVLAASVSAQTVESASPAPVERRDLAFGMPLLLIVHDLPAADAQRAIEAAVVEVRQIEALTDGAGLAADGVGALNRAAGGAPLPIDPRLAEALGRAQQFCTWSSGANGPTGGALYDLWGLRRSVPRQPAGPDLSDAISSAACDHLWIDPAAGNAQLAVGSRVELWPFAAGLAVDRATEVLVEQGVTNGWVEIGGVMRAFGPGADQRGWPVQLPPFKGQVEALAPFWLRDRALAVVAQDDRRLLLPAGADHPAPYIDLRRGQPASGVVAVLVATTLAIDARGLAVTLFITGNYDGHRRLGNLKPAPAVRWLLGQGNAPPLLADYRWSSIRD